MRKDLVRREREEVEMRGFEVECACNEGKKD
jgi:NADPH-dependent glutamate synthase beta subunit-like oxidoreductase